MQTFLSYPDFNESARVLDDKRLGKQRVECLQILNVLAIGPYQRARCNADTIFPVWESCPVDEWQKDKINYEYRKTPWYNHPAVRMWRGYEYRLTCYGICICREWQQRGYADTCMVKIVKHQADLYKILLDQHGPCSLGSVSEQHKPYPPWLGNPAFHAAHRSNLLRKNAKHYSQFGWTEPHDLPYVWPV